MGFALSINMFSPQASRLRFFLWAAFGPQHSANAQRRFRCKIALLLMRRISCSLSLACIFLFSLPLAALDRQDAGAYHARRVALSQKTNGGVVVLFAPVERPDEIFGFHQDSNFYYLSGWTEPGAGLLIAPAVGGQAHAGGNTASRPYTEIL